MSSAQSENRLLEVDEASDVLLSLRLLNHAMSCLEIDPGWFKWVIISLHSAIQGAAVCHLSGAMNTGALTDNSAKGWIEYHNNRSNENESWPDDVVASFPELMSRLRSTKKKFDRCSATVSMTNEQINMLIKLNGFRRDFTHFSPKGWTIEVSGTVNIVKVLIPLIDEINSIGWAFRHLNSEDSFELQKLIDKLS